MIKFVGQFAPSTSLLLVFSAVVFLLTAIAALIAGTFAAEHKPHVLAHTLLAYLLVWSLLIIYGWTHRSGRYAFSTQVLVALIIFLAFLGFIHIDDAPARLLFDRAEPRPAAPRLYWASALNLASGIILTAHLVTRRRIRRLEAREQRPKQT